jgi:16S rRNA (uracil1498-N3)-methyltransferase
VFIGGESGFSDAERILAAQYAQGYSLGPRILRTETAAIVAVALLQQRYGDL